MRDKSSSSSVLSLLTVVPASADMVADFGLDTAPVRVCGQAEHDRRKG
jgi:hypothetical protein